MLQCRFLGPRPKCSASLGLEWGPGIRILYIGPGVILEPPEWRLWSSETWVWIPAPPREL